MPLGTEPPRLHATHSTSTERHVGSVPDPVFWDGSLQAAFFGTARRQSGSLAEVTVQMWPSGSANEAA